MLSFRLVRVTDKAVLPELPARTVLCPLCGESQCRVIDILPVADLCSEYARQFGADVRSEFPVGISDLTLRECGRCELQYFHPLFSGSARFYARMAEADFYYSTSRWEFTQALRWIQEKKHVIDVGCGDGHFLSLIPHGNKLGLEFNPEAVKRARARGLDVREEDLTRLDDASTDAVTLFQVLEHVVNPLELLCQAVRVLRPEGLLIIAVPNNDAFIGESIQDPLNVPPHHPLRWRRETLKYLTRLVPVRLEELKEEPLRADQLFHFRRTLFTRFVQRCLGRKLPLMKLTVFTVLTRKVANGFAYLSMKLRPDPPSKPVSGHSMLAVYRKLP